uniref:Uncharacterized protein n=1 Tax=Brassica oleracea var. oleracea TaxID=109376 RepID=A0A0D3CK85_BRAOL
MAFASHYPYEGSDDENFDQYFEQAFENFTIDYGNQEEGRRRRKKRAYNKRKRETGHLRLWNDYFSETPMYPDNLFRRRFRMNKPLFMRIVDRLSNEYLRRPTPADLQRLPAIGEQRGFPGMIGSIDCMHWEWKNCPITWKGTLNDINVLDRSPVFDDIINGQAPQVTFSVNGREYHLAYYLTDGIYPKWATFIQSISIPQGPKAILFAQHQEAV